MDDPRPQPTLAIKTSYLLGTLMGISGTLYASVILTRHSPSTAESFIAAALLGLSAKAIQAGQQLRKQQQQLQEKKSTPNPGPQQTARSASPSDEKSPSRIDSPSLHDLEAMSNVTFSSQRRLSLASSKSLAGLCESAFPFIALVPTSLLYAVALHKEFTTPHTIRLSPLIGIAVGSLLQQALLEYALFGLRKFMELSRNLIIACAAFLISSQLPAPHNVFFLPAVSAIMLGYNYSDGIYSLWKRFLSTSTPPDWHDQSLAAFITPRTRYDYGLTGAGLLILIASILTSALTKHDPDQIANFIGEILMMIGTYLACRSIGHHSVYRVTPNRFFIQQRLSEFMLLLLIQPTLSPISVLSNSLAAWLAHRADEINRLSAYAKQTQLNAYMAELAATLSSNNNPTTTQQFITNALTDMNITVYHGLLDWLKHMNRARRWFVSFVCGAFLLLGSVSQYTGLNTGTLSLMFTATAVLYTLHRAKQPNALAQYQHYDTALINSIKPFLLYSLIFVYTYSTRNSSQFIYDDAGNIVPSHQQPQAIIGQHILSAMIGSLFWCNAVRHYVNIYQLPELTVDAIQTAKTTIQTAVENKTNCLCLPLNVLLALKRELEKNPLFPAQLMMVAPKKPDNGKQTPPPSHSLIQRCYHYLLTPPQEPRAVQPVVKLEMDSNTFTLFSKTPPLHENNELATLFGRVAASVIYVTAVMQYLDMFTGLNTLGVSAGFKNR